MYSNTFLGNFHEIFRFINIKCLLSKHDVIWLCLINEYINSSLAYKSL